MLFSFTCIRDWCSVGPGLGWVFNGIGRCGRRGGVWVDSGVRKATSPARGVVESAGSVAGSAGRCLAGEACPVVFEGGVEGAYGGGSVVLVFAGGECRSCGLELRVRPGRLTPGLLGSGPWPLRCCCAWRSWRRSAAALTPGADDPDAAVRGRWLRCGHRPAGARAEPRAGGVHLVTWREEHGIIGRPRARRSLGPSVDDRSVADPPHPRGEDRPERRGGLWVVGPGCAGPLRWGQPLTARCTVCRWAWAIVRLARNG